MTRHVLADIWLQIVVPATPWVLAVLFIVFSNDGNKKGVIR